MIALDGAAGEGGGQVLRTALSLALVTGQPFTLTNVRAGRPKPGLQRHWFWIEEGDWLTKRALTAVMFFFTLAETGGNDKLPLITIPAQ